MKKARRIRINFHAQARAEQRGLPESYKLLNVFKSAKRVGMTNRCCAIYESSGIRFIVREYPKRWHIITVYRPGEL